MCGITGVVAFNDQGRTFFKGLGSAVQALSKRGPDNQGTFMHKNIVLGHTRLAVIDTSDAATQPFTDESGRYTIVFNGEFYNYREHRKALQDKGVPFRSESDTEVLLYLYIREGVACLDKINGFFAFAIYDNAENSLFIARDRYGIKPLLVYRDKDKLIFASEMKSLLAYDIPREVDRVSLFTYLQLNYIPAPHSIFENVFKLDSGSYIMIKDNFVEQIKYYCIPYEDKGNVVLPYEKAKEELAMLLEESVQRRLVADVPLGTFLSGGIDSSVITALAARHTEKLKTFSIGYKDEPLFDETRYAKLVAKKYNTDHTVFRLDNRDIFENMYKVLDYIDEPFADSSALAVYILSMYTRKYVTVALSGDGADELFGGYNKHMAELKLRRGGIVPWLVKQSGPLLNRIPKSRNSAFGNTIRQLQRFSEGMRLSAAERYWRWAGYANEREAELLLRNPHNREVYQNRKSGVIENIRGNDGINDVLYTDMHLVLQNDMLVKTDMMSMANSLEVRVPFLDYKIVNFVASLPETYKIDSHSRKKILKDAFRPYLPQEIYQRGKHGFEVPLLKWFRIELKSLITEDLLNDHFIEKQGIFEVTEVQRLKKKLFSRDPGDIVARIWGLLVFQYWWKKYMD